MNVDQPYVCIYFHQTIPFRDLIVVGIPAGIETPEPKRKAIFLDFEFIFLISSPPKNIV